MKKKILFVNGPNLGMLGFRDPKVYGTTTLLEIESEAKREVAAKGLECLCFQSNIEGEIVDFLNKQYLAHVRKESSVAGVVINPGAYSHTSIAIRDALEVFSSASIPVFEVHLSNIFAREEYRRKTITGEVARAMISGFGAAGYRMALSQLLTQEGN